MYARFAASAPPLFLRAVFVAVGLGRQPGVFPELVVEVAAVVEAHHAVQVGDFKVLVVADELLRVLQPQRHAPRAERRMVHVLEIG